MHTYYTLILNYFIKTYIICNFIKNCQYASNKNKVLTGKNLKTFKVWPMNILEM